MIAEQTQIDRPKSKLGKLAAILAVAGTFTAGMAALATNALSIRENIVKLFASRPAVLVEIKLRDVRGVSASIWKKHAYASVEAVIEKKGGAALDCVGGLLVGNIEYSPNGADWGAVRQRGGDGFDLGGYKPSYKLRIAEGDRQGIGEFDYTIYPEQFQRDAKFRLDCNTIVTTWVPLKLPELK